MNISRWQTSSYEEAYGILCSAVPGLHGREAIYPTFCRVAAQSGTQAHAHFEVEVYLIIAGDGIMRIGAETAAVQAGDLIKVPAFAEHALSNAASEDLIFLSVYSADYEVARLPQTAVITAAPPTPNGPLHLGHISGPYLAHDVLRRYWRLRSVAVSSHSGTDDHQNYVTKRAKDLGQVYDVFHTTMRSRIKAGFDATLISFDEFVEPRRDGAYLERVHDFIRRAIAASVVRREKLLLPYCEACDHFLVDAQIEGTCPYCAAASSGACESCGMVAAPQDLIQAHCTQCHGAAQTKGAEAYIFCLSDYLPLIKADLRDLSLPPRLRSLVNAAFDRPSIKLLMTYPSSSDVDLKLSDADQAIHVWFEMAAHYERFSAGTTPWVHCFGFDNAFYYLLMIPALHKAVNPDTHLPQAVITNEFLTLDGAKFSTSRQHAIWADEFQGHPDHLRFYLGMQRPATRTSDFTRESFARFSADMATKLQQLNVRARAVRGVSGAVDPEALIACQRFSRAIERFLSPQHFDLRRAARRLLEFIDTCLQASYGARSEKLLLQVLATLLSPIMPTAAADLAAALGVDLVWCNDWVGTL